MTEQEKELEDMVKRIILKVFNEYREQLIKAVAKYLADEGYTKSKFPIEGLKAWLEEGVKNKGIGMVVKSQGKDCFEGQGDLALGQISHIIKLAFRTIFDKLEEL